MRKWAFGVALIGLVVCAVGCKVVVTPSASNGWFFVNEGANGTGYYTNGPAVPPEGRGSALLSIDGTGREGIGTLQYQGTSLSTITSLSYSTYQAYSGSPHETPTLAFDVDYDANDSSSAYQGRLVYVPSVAGAVAAQTWQTWNTLTGTGAWYSSASGSSGYRPIVGDTPQTNPPCNQTTYCTWSTILADYPNARVRPSSGLFLIRAGGPTTGGFVGATDAVTVGINGNDLTWDFEPGDGHVPVNAANAASLNFGFVQETPTGSGAFVSGPNGSDGSGSAKLKVDSTGGEALATGVFAGTRFDALTFVSYKTFVQPGYAANAPTLQFDVDYDATDATTAYQGRAVFEPSIAGGTAVANGVWQTWNPLTAPSGWWQTGNPIVGGVTGTKVCTEGTPCSWHDFLQAYPNAQVRPVTTQSAGNPVAGGLWLKAGAGWSGGFGGYVDSLTVAVKIGAVNGTVTYDMEH